MRIEAHQHFWLYEPVEYGWIGDGMDALKCKRLPADHAPLLESARLDGSAAVQARSTEEYVRNLSAVEPADDGRTGSSSTRGDP